MNSTYLCRIGIKDGRGILATAKAIEDGYAVNADVFHLEIGNYYFRRLLRDRREWQCSPDVEDQAIHTNPVNAFMFEPLYLMDGETALVDLARHLGVYNNRLYAMLIGHFYQMKDGKISFIVDYDEPTSVICLYDDNSEEEISDVNAKAFAKSYGMVISPIFGKVRAFNLDMVVTHRVYENIAIEEGECNADLNRFDSEIIELEGEGSTSYGLKLMETRQMIIRSIYA